MQQRNKKLYLCYVCQCLKYLATLSIPGPSLSHLNRYNSALLLKPSIRDQQLISCTFLYICYIQEHTALIIVPILHQHLYQFAFAYKMLRIVPISYQEFRSRQIVNESFEMLEAELDKVRHRSYPDWDDNDSNPGMLIEQLDDENGDAGSFIDEEDENIGLVTGVIELRRYSYPSIDVLSDDPFSDENRMEHFGHEEDCNDYSDDPSNYHVGVEDVLSLSMEVSERFPSTSPQQRLSVDSARSSVSYTDLYITNSRGSVFAAPVHPRWSTDARPSIPFEGTDHTILSKRIIEDEDKGAVNQFNLAQFVPSIMSLHLIMATTGTLPTFTQGYAPGSAEPDEYQIFCADARCADARREAEEAEILELLQQRSIRRRDQNLKQSKREKVKDIVMKPVRRIRQTFSGHHAQHDIETESTQVLLSPVYEDQRDRDILEDLQRRSLEHADQCEKERKKGKAIKPVKKIGQKILGLCKRY